jgi:DNA-binding protein HU-beta
MVRSGLRSLATSRKKSVIAGSIVECPCRPGGVRNITPPDPSTTNSVEREDKAVATRVDVARAVAEKEKISIQNANSIIGSTIEVIGDLVKRGELHLVGLGSFKLVTRAARQGRNPRTGEAIGIPAKTVVHFKPSKTLNPLVPVERAGKGRGGKAASAKKKKR